MTGFAGSGLVHEGVAAIEGAVERSGTLGMFAGLVVGAVLTFIVGRGRPASTARPLAAVVAALCCPAVLFLLTSIGRVDRGNLAQLRSRSWQSPGRSFSPGWLVGRQTAPDDQQQGLWSAAPPSVHRSVSNAQHEPARHHVRQPQRPQAPRPGSAGPADDGGGLRAGAVARTARAPARRAGRGAAAGVPDVLGARSRADPCALPSAVRGWIASSPLTPTRIGREGACLNRKAQCRHGRAECVDAASGS